MPELFVGAEDARKRKREVTRGEEGQGSRIAKEFSPQVVKPFQIAFLAALHSH